MNLPKPKEIIIIYHADCIDGYGAAWSAFMDYGNQARYVPARFGEPFQSITRIVKYIFLISRIRQILFWMRLKLLSI